MPTVFEIEGFRFFFYREAKFWLDPIRPARLSRFKANEMRRILEILEENQVHILERWNEHFNV